MPNRHPCRLALVRAARSATMDRACTTSSASQPPRPPDGRLARPPPAVYARAMSLNPPDLRPDRAPPPRLDRPARPGQPRVGMVSLGCPKALVDSERILTRLRAEGYAISPDYAGADVVIVNTCGFLDSPRPRASRRSARRSPRTAGSSSPAASAPTSPTSAAPIPSVLAVTGPHQYEAVLDAVHDAVPPAPDPFVDLLPASAVHLTPRHYSYLKISEGCNHKCRFCIIPDMRGRLVSRPAHAVLREAEKLVAAGVRELLVISQDTSAYGVDRQHDAHAWNGREVRSHITDLARELGALGAWVRLHYVYPYPHVRDLIPLMADGLILPYLDIPFQHATPTCCSRWRAPPRRTDPRRDRRMARDCPDLTLRSTFIVGYPGETEAEFQHLLDWLDEAQLDRVGAFQYENVAGARANALPDHVPEEVKQERWDRFMEKAQAISAAKLAAKVGTRVQVIVDEVDDDGATCRTKADAPEIDGNLFIDEGFETLKPGDIVTVKVDDADDYDLWGSIRLSRRQCASTKSSVSSSNVSLSCTAPGRPHVLEAAWSHRRRTPRVSAARLSTSSCSSESATTSDRHLDRRQAVTAHRRRIGLAYARHRVRCRAPGPLPGVEAGEAASQAGVDRLDLRPRRPGSVPGLERAMMCRNPRRRHRAAPRPRRGRTAPRPGRPRRAPGSAAAAALHRRPQRRRPASDSPTTCTGSPIACSSATWSSLCTPRERACPTASRRSRTIDGCKP